MAARKRDWTRPGRGSIPERSLAEDYGTFQGEGDLEVVLEF